MIKLRVWHIPQVPGPAFYVPVANPAEAIKIMNVLADYDAFQLTHCIKPDYSNVQGFEEFNEDTQEWEDWYSADGQDIDEYIEFVEALTADQGFEP